MDTTPLNKHGYPEAWPQSSPRLLSIVNSISHEQKRDLYTRKITTRDLALKLGVVEGYISYLFPGKALGYGKAKKSLLATRREYRRSFAQRVVNGNITLKAATEDSKIPSRSLARLVRELKKKQEGLKNDQTTV